jgi:hypothetical protein
MKSVKWMLILAVVNLTAAVYAQTQAGQATQAATPSDAQKSFAILKTLAGNWEGSVSTDPKDQNDGDKIAGTIRVTSRGNAIVHEMKDPAKPDDATKYDHPVTMLYVDNDKLFLTHYCDAGNRPRMVARPSVDGKKVEFDLVDVSGPLTYGHMQHAVFTAIDENHHIEEWTYLLPNGKAMHATLDMHRVKDNTIASLK